MQPVKLSIAGKFWDSQIYSGELLIIDENCSLHRIDWRGAIDSIAKKNQDIQTALRVAFSDSDLFYNEKVRKILKDPHIEFPIKKQLEEFSHRDIEISDSDWKKFWDENDSPFNFLPVDTEIYYSHLFACGEEGLFSAPRSARETSNRNLEQVTKKHHDASTLQIKASDRNTAIATAAGADGLFEFSLKKDSDKILENEKQVAERPCSACDWAFQSILGWTANDAFLANYIENKDQQTNKTIRAFDKILDLNDILSPGNIGLESSTFTWGSREKVYRLTETGILVTNYQPKSKSGIDSDRFLDREYENIRFKHEPVIATGTAPFGTVIEFNDHIIVLRSDGIINDFPGEAVHWRIFPRSEHYSNQLHIIYDDKIEIISFTHDYFVNQKTKKYGFSKGAI